MTFYGFIKQAALGKYAVDKQDIKQTTDTVVDKAKGVANKAAQMVSSAYDKSEQPVKKSVTTAGQAVADTGKAIGKKIKYGWDNPEEVANKGQQLSKKLTTKVAPQRKAVKSFGKAFGNIKSIYSAFQGGVDQAQRQLNANSGR